MLHTTGSFMGGTSSSLMSYKMPRCTHHTSLQLLAEHEHSSCTALCSCFSGSWQDPLQRCMQEQRAEHK